MNERVMDMPDDSRLLFNVREMQFKYNMILARELRMEMREGKLRVLKGLPFTKSLQRLRNL